MNLADPLDYQSQEDIVCVAIMEYDFSGHALFIGRVETKGMTLSLLGKKSNMSVFPVNTV